MGGGVDLKYMLLVVFVLMWMVPVAIAQTYRWTDRQGVMHFTDNLKSIPPAYRKRVISEEDITIQNPKVMKELKEQEERARQEELNKTPIPVTPDYVPPTPAVPPQQVTPPKSVGDELPPGRPKSQRVRENREKREAEEAEKLKQEKHGY